MDNDGDGRIDMQDPGCSNPNDNDESNVICTANGAPQVIAQQYLSQVNCVRHPNNPQICMNPPSVTVNLPQTTQNVSIQYSTITNAHGPVHCSAVSAHLWVDGAYVGTTPFLQPETISPSIFLGTLTAGSHIIQIQGTGTAGGCNYGALSTWGGHAVLSVPTQICPNVPHVPQCRDGIDNDGDGRIDFPSDAGCMNADDNDESNVVVVIPQCRDGIDNDGDGKVDFPQDPGCMNADDNDESNVTYALPQCSDGMDNDGDGRTDFFDPGCYPNNVFNPVAYNPNDNDESNAAILCRWARTNNQWVRQCQ